MRDAVFGEKAIFQGRLKRQFEVDFNLKKCRQRHNEF